MQLSLLWHLHKKLRQTSKNPKLTRTCHQAHHFHFQTSTHLTSPKRSSLAPSKGTHRFQHLPPHLQIPHKPSTMQAIYTTKLLPFHLIPSLQDHPNHVPYQNMLLTLMLVHELFQLQPPNSGTSFLLPSVRPHQFQLSDPDSKPTFSGKPILHSTPALPLD